MYFCSQCWYTLCLYRERNTQFNWLCLLTCVSCKTCHCLLVVIYLAALHIGLPLNCSSCGLNAEPRLGCWRVWRFDGSHWNGPDRLCGPNRTHLPQTHRYLTLRLHSNYSELLPRFRFSHESQDRGSLWPLTCSCHPGNLWDPGAHGKPVAQSPSQIRLLTSWNKQVSEVCGRQQGEEWGLNNQSLVLKDELCFYHEHEWTARRSAHGMRSISETSAAPSDAATQTAEKQLCCFSWLFRNDI